MTDYNSSFRKRVGDTTPEIFNLLLDKNNRIIDKNNTSIVSYNQYISNFNDYLKRLHGEVDEYNSALNKIQTDEREYQSAISLSNSENETDLESAVEIFEKLGHYKDSETRLKKCNEILHHKSLEKSYAYAISFMESNTDDGYKEAAIEFEKIIDFEDSRQKLKECKYLLHQRFLEKGYVYAVSLMEADTKEAYDQAIEEFKKLGNYKDSNDLMYKCQIGFIYLNARSLMYDRIESSYLKAAEEFGKILDYKNSKELRKEGLNRAKELRRLEHPISKKIAVVLIFVILIVGIGISAFVIMNYGNQPIQVVQMQQTPVPLQTTSSIYGGINIVSAPIGAAVYINDEYKGITPLLIEGLSKGTYTVKISKDDKGYVDATEIITISPGTIIEKNIVLTLGGTVNVITSPSGASIYLDGSYKGISPVSITGVSKGSHTIIATLSGYSNTNYKFEMTDMGSLGVSIPLDSPSNFV